MQMPDKNSKLVYSTNPNVNKEIGLAKQSSKSEWIEDIPPEKQQVKISLDSKGRKGKTVTLVKGLQHAPNTLTELARDLKQYCGCGGTVKEQIIEIQGDQRKIIEKKLTGMGYRVRVL